MAKFVNRFAGTAAFYAQFRPDYPAPVYDEVSNLADLDGGTSSVLDLGCGPGIIALALAGRAHTVVGVDPDPGMVEQAEQASHTRGVRNVRFVCSTAEEFADALESFDLVTIGSAFHWMDRPAVAERVYGLLKPGGFVALLGNPTPLMDVRDGQGVGDAIVRVQERWLRPEERPATPFESQSHEDILRASSFGGASTYYFPSRQQWSVDRLIGFLRSASWRPDQVLGDRFPDFVNELRSAVLEIEPSGEWVDTRDVQLIVARR